MTIKLYSIYDAYKHITAIWEASAVPPEQLIDNTYVNCKEGLTAQIDEILERKAHVALLYFINPNYGKVSGELYIKSIAVTVGNDG